MMAAYRRCQSFEDYFGFARDWMHGGAMQEPEEIRSALDYIRAARPRCVCEIGTANGGTNLLLSQTLDSVETIIAVDLFIMNSAYLRRLLRPSQRIDLVNGSSYAPRTFERVRALLGGKKIDLLFIDGDHRYEGVKRDFLIYSQLVHEGGLIAFHDIVPDHRSRYGRPTARGSGGVPVLWNELKKKYHHREFVGDYDQDAFGIGVLHWSVTASKSKALHASDWGSAISAV